MTRQERPCSEEMQTGSKRRLIIKFNQNESIGVDLFISLLVAVAAAPAVDLTPHAISHAFPAAVSHVLGLPEAVGCALPLVRQVQVAPIGA